MRFQPKSEKEIQEERFPVLKPGKYHFEVVESKEDVSKKGNDMIVLKLKIMDESFNVLTYLNDYLMESIAHKLRRASYGCGLGNYYETGELSAHSFLGKTGSLELTIQKDKTGQYSDKNSVQDYLQEDKDNKQQASKSEWDDGMPIQEPPHWAK